MSETRRVVIVGGGLSGLVAAYRLSKECAAKGVDLRLTLLEASPRLGGNIVTERHDGFQIDGGPDAWVAAKPEGVALCRELGLGDEFIETIPENRRVYLLNAGELTPLPEGIVLGVPTQLLPVLRTKLLSPRAKARVALDLVLPRRDVDDDLSLGELVERRMGREVVEALTEPLLAGIYAGDAWSLSARSTFPQLIEMSKRGGLLKGAGAAAPQRSGGALPSTFVSLKRGTGSMIDALEAAIPPGVIRRSTRVTAVRRGERSPWEVALVDGEVIEADAVVLAMPSHKTAGLIEGAAPDAARAMRAIPWSSAATVFFAWRRSEVPHPMDATGFIVPKREGRAVLAATFVSSKWPGRVPEGMALIRAFVGGVGHEDRVSMPDDEMAVLAFDELRSILGVRAAPKWTRVYRFVETSPQPRVGHAARVAAVRAEVAKHAGLRVLGSWLDGVGIPDVIRLADKTARAMVA
ncbi:MAG: protoporphyrinogen oxidase [Polyangiales bacterium]